MKPEQARRAAVLFEEAISLPSDERAAFLARLDGADEEIRQEVESLLAADLEAGGTTADGGLGTRPDEPPPPPFGPGSEVGPYRLLRKLGEGGMGAVYLAERRDGALGRLVAVKAVSHGPLRPDVMRRLETERQILAHLDHPAIARVFDAGQTARGMPYFVMEYIDGEPIDRYCASRRLALRERLELFRQVCLAVHYAHQNLIIHRDLKPGNILVTASGQPKLLDFGIAKPLDPRLAGGRGDLTRAGERPLTPRYASPEQLQGRPVATTSDIYSLGVLLFELLTGKTPFALDGKSEAEFERLVSSTEPERPSQVLARLQGREARGLGRAVAGDLDAIAAKALRKEPHERYASAEQLAEDIGRHLAGLPVVARRGNARYRAGRFLRRHRVAAAAVAAFLVFALATAIALATQAARLAEQRDAARRERDKAHAVVSFLAGLLRAEGTERPRGETIAIMALLDSGVRRIEADLRDQPETQADLLATMGQMDLDLGLYRPARKAFEEALATRRALLGPADERVAESLTSLATLEQEVGHYAAAEKLARSSLAILRRRLGPEHGALLRGQLQLGILLFDEGNLAGAEATLRRLLARVPETGGGPRGGRAAILDALGQVLLARGDAAGAWGLCGEALELRRRDAGTRSRAYADTLNDLGLAARAAGRPIQAEELLQRTEDLARTLFGDKHVLQVVTLHNLALLAADRGDYRQAAALDERGLATARDLFPAGHPQLAFPLVGLGAAHLARGDAAAAEGPLREAVAIRRAALPAGHWLTARAERLLEACLRARGAQSRPRGTRLTPAGDHAGPPDRVGGASSTTGPQAAPGRSGGEGFSADPLPSALVPRTLGWCVPDGGVDDTLTRYSCCSGVAVAGTTVCADPRDRGTTWASCSQLCGTRLVGGCVPPGGVDDTLHATECCSGAAVPGSTRCLNPADYGTTWASCVQTCA